jgi:hypothetical protein
MAIKQGDIVASDGRIKTLQDGRRRFIEFGSATVVSVEGDQITVNPVGKKAIIVCQREDLLSGNGNDSEPEPESAPTEAHDQPHGQITLDVEPPLAPEPSVPKSSPSLAGLAKKPAARKPPAKKAKAKRSAARRRKSS